MFLCCGGSDNKKDNKKSQLLKRPQNFVNTKISLNLGPKFHYKLQPNQSQWKSQISMNKQKQNVNSNQVEQQMKKILEKLTDKGKDLRQKIIKLQKQKQIAQDKADLSLDQIQKKRGLIAVLNYLIVKEELQIQNYIEKIGAH